jgi:hypothetical protein
MSASPSFRLRAWCAAGAVVAASLVTACAAAGPSLPTAPPATDPADASSSPALSPSNPVSSAPAAGPSSPAPSPVSTAPSTGPAVPAQPAASPTSPTPSASGGTGTGLAACRTAALHITVGDDQVQGAAGSAYYPLDFTNVSAVPCQMYGYPGVSFATAPNGAGQQIGAAAARSRDFAKLTVRLEAGGTAHAWLKVTVAANYPASDCQPVTARWVRVYPPEETVPGYVSHSFAACSSATTALLTVLPVRSGQGIAGAMP